MTVCAAAICTTRETASGERQHAIVGIPDRMLTAGELSTSSRTASRF